MSGPSSTPPWEGAGTQFSLHSAGLLQGSSKIIRTEDAFINWEAPSQPPGPCHAGPSAWQPAVTHFAGLLRVCFVPGHLLRC